MSEQKEVMNFMEVSKKQSIKTRLQNYFLLVSLSILLLMSVFSLVYFYNTTKKESTTMIRNKLSLAEIFMDGKKKETEEYAKNLASQRSIQLGLELESGIKISEFIESLENESSVFKISVFDADGGMLTENMSLSSSDTALLQSALSGTVSTSPCQVNNLTGKTPAYVSAVPVMYNDEIIGVVMVYFVFVENQDFFQELSHNLECEMAIYTENSTVVSTGELPIVPSLYKNVAYSSKPYEDISLASSGLNEYKALVDGTDFPVAVYRIYLSSDQYRKVFITALVVYIVIATLVTIIVISLILQISASILNPIDQLLNSVNIVRSGDLSHEISLVEQDEIGRLGYAFNELRSQLSDKIGTIQDMNSSLERTVSERTATINTLNEKMKHYLSPQLYASIVGGKRDTSVDKHYRKRLTIFFSDVVNFTKTTESLEPEDLSNLLNSYLDSMANIAMKYGGTIDKYVGDAIMVFFGDPEFTSDKDHAIRAVEMAMEMQESMISFREKWRKNGIENPFHVRVGINTGYCTIGNFGSETKMDYTIIGNNVNMAARFEAAAEPDTILMSPETFMLVSDEIDCVVAGEYTLKGVSGTIKGYRPVRIKDAASKVEFAKVTSRGELIYPEKPIDLKLLSPKDRHNLLRAIKETFEEIRDNKLSAVIKPVKKDLDGDEGKAKKVESESTNDA
ncbi:MAG: HAMP domain-containing protein [Treponema sp.]|nr:HAMP domain-containing protein [Treponema sp.]